MTPAPIKCKVQSGSLRLEIREYADGRFGFDYKPPGEHYRTRVRLADLAQAKERAGELIGLAEAGRVQRLEINPDEYMEFLRWKALRKAPAMIPSLVDTFLSSKEDKGRTPATLRGLRGVLEPFAEAFPGPIAEAGRADVERWLKSRDVGARTWNNMRSAIFALHHFARAEGLLSTERTPVERMERKAVSVHVGTYTAEEMAKVLAAAPAKWIPALAIGAFCGNRWEEIAPDVSNSGDKPGLRWENVLWEKGKIDVPAAVSKVRRRRFATLTDAARAFIEPHRQRHGSIAPPYKNSAREMRAIFADAKVKRQANALRHSYASYRLALTKDAPALALEMGNSPGMIFRHYLDLKHEDEAEAWFALRPK